MKQFDFNKYLKNNPLLKENKNLIKEGIETMLLAVINDQADDMSFLDGVSDEEFVMALKKLGLKYKTFNTGGGMSYYIDKPRGGKIEFQNDGGDWFAGDVHDDEETGDSYDVDDQYDADADPKNIINVLKSKYPNFDFDQYQTLMYKYEIPARIWQSQIGLDKMSAKQLQTKASKGYIDFSNKVVAINTLLGNWN